MEPLQADDPRDIGGYRLLRRLGAGGMGRVYLARTPGGRPLALKTILARHTRDDGFQQRFEREIRHADRVRSPWTVPVVDWSRTGGEAPGPRWLATEYVPAPSLEDRVLAAGPLPLPLVRELAAELAGALAAVHAEGLVHRDLKPSNVLLAAQRPQLIDFGIARAVEDLSLTRTGGVVGSPGYLAPEQAGGTGPPGPAVDVFALGAVLIHAATGHGPFQRGGENPGTPSLLYRVVHEDPVLDDLPAELRPLVERLLAKDPADRPTAAELVADPAAHGLDRPGRWAARLPEDLREELARRTAEAERLCDPSTGPDAPAGSATPRASTAPTVPPTAPAFPPPVPAVTPPPGFGPAVPPAGFGPPTGGPPPHHPFRPGHLPHGPPAPPPRRSGAPKPLIIAGSVFGALVMLLAVWAQLPESGTPAGGSGGTGSTSTSGGGNAPDPEPEPDDRLPAAWEDIWVGEGGGAPGTGPLTAVLELTGGEVGEVVGTVETSAIDDLLGIDYGCAETLRLEEVVDTATVTLRVIGTRSVEAGWLDEGCPRDTVYTMHLEEQGDGSDTIRVESDQPPQENVEGVEYLERSE